MPENIGSDLVLAGFLGAIKNPPPTPQQYGDAHYQFKGEAEPRHAKFFSIALREFLKANGRAPRRWLIMGTEKSIWDALYEAVPAERWEEESSADLLKKVTEAVRVEAAGHSSGRRIDQDLLTQWGQALSHLLQIEVVCFLTGNAEEPQEQAKVWSAIEQHVKKGDEVVFDVTHSLRHFAVISTFSVMLLRELRGIEKVDFYYGALELTTEGISHVIHIPICQQLAEASQAVATHKLTGDFRSLGRCLNVSADFNRKLTKVAYADELNRPESKLADELSKEIPKSNSFLREVLEPELKRSLGWIEGKGLDIQYRHKAQAAFGCGQYFKAVAYLYEAMLMAQMYHLHKKRNDEDYLNHKKRKEVSEDLKSLETYNPLFNRDAQLALDTYLQVEYLRNAVLHGTKAMGGAQSTNVERAIRHEPVLIVMLQNGFVLFDELSGLADKDNPPSLRTLPPVLQYP